MAENRKWSKSRNKKDIVIDVFRYYVDFHPRSETDDNYQNSRPIRF